MSILQLLLGTLAGICIATGIIFLFTGLRRPGGDLPLHRYTPPGLENLTSSPPILLNLELEQNALLLYSR